MVAHGMYAWNVHMALLSDAFMCNLSDERQPDKESAGDERVLR